jgi:hypothetical protein
VVTVNPDGWSTVYGLGTVVFAHIDPVNPNLFNPFPDLGTTGGDWQMDVFNIHIVWYNSGAEFMFPSVFYDPTDYGTQAIVSVVHGDVRTDSGSLPALGTGPNP